jgi:hypothetical protein
MVVEPESLGWLEGRKVVHRDGPTWAETLARFPRLEYLVCDGGSGLHAGIDLARRRRRAAGDGLALECGLDAFHTLRDGRRAVRATWRRVTEAIERAEELDRTLASRAWHGRSLQGHGGAAGVAWRKAEALWDRALGIEAAWDGARSALGLFTPEGRPMTRSLAEAVLARAIPRLIGPEWAKARRALGRRESLTFLDRAERGLAGLSLSAQTLGAILSLEGARRAQSRPGRAAAAARGLALVRAVQLSKTDPDWEESAARVRRVLRDAWRASSLVECLNGVARMQQARHRKMTQGLLDLKRLYWNLRRFHTGRRRGKAPYELLGVRLPELSWWELLKMPPERLRQHLSASGLGP